MEKKKASWLYKGGVMKSKEIREYLIGLIEEYKNGIIDKNTVYDRAEALVSDNELEYSEDENLKCVLEHILPDACLLYIDEPGDEREKEKDFYESMCECEKLLKYKS